MSTDMDTTNNAPEEPVLDLDPSNNAVQEPTVSSVSGPGPGPGPGPVLVENQLDEEFVVERILDQREVGNQIYYLIKWQGFGDQDNTWEPEDNLADCPEVLEEYHRQRDEQLKLMVSNPMAAVEKDIPYPMNSAARALCEANGEALEQNGFERGLEAQRIIGATDCGGELCFLVKWKGSEGSNICDIVPAREANLKCPQVVIKFYEERIKWNTTRTLEEMLDLENDEPNGTCVRIE